MWIKILLIKLFVFFKFFNKICIIWLKVVVVFDKLNGIIVNLNKLLGVINEVRFLFLFCMGIC